MNNIKCLAATKKLLFLSRLCLVAYGLLVCSERAMAQDLPVAPVHNFDFLKQLNKQPHRLYIPKIDPAQNSPPKLQLPPPAQSLESQRLSEQLKIEVKRIELMGHTVFSDEQLKAIISPYEGKMISSFDLFKLRNAINLFYINHGYINSGAIIPDQDISDGLIKINIIEGQLNKISVTGNNWLEADYITERLRIGNQKILDLGVLQQQIKIIHQDRLINRVNAQLIPGENPGESELKVDIEESRPYALNIAFNNLRNPSVGELQGVIYGEFMNLTGYGDSLSAHFSVTEGLENGGISYTIPVSAYDTKIFAFYEHTNAEVVEEPFASAGINSSIANYGLGITQPYYFSPNSKFLASIQFERKTSQTHFLGETYDFVTGTAEEESKVTVLRFVGEWVYQQPSYVLAIRSTFNVGLDALDATRQDGNLPDGQFFSWLGQFQWVQRFAETGIKVLLRSDVQLTPDALLPIEKMGIGGYYSVRGYRENKLVRDNGWVSSIEVRFPLFKLPLLGAYAEPADGSLEFAIFYDFGWSKNTVQFTSDPRATSISSVGVGLRWDPHNRIHSELYWGYALRHIDQRGENSLQDNGIQFVVDIKLF